MFDRPISRWLLLCTIILAAILVPFFLFGEKIESWTDAFLQSASDRAAWIAAFVGFLLASDILLPVPSSLVSTAAGLFLGFLSGTLTSWAGMTISCLVGLWLGRKFGRPLAVRLVGEKELQRLEELGRRFGDWVMVISRPVPVLAEASVLFAGIGRMPTHRFVLLTTLSNLGISAVYAAVGAFSATINSFLLAFAGAILLPLLTMVAVRVRGDHVA